tara:strand:+ start:2369 stop:3079 length:711 start_codon:yes stop_codon:yes gene_type:complete
MYSYLNFSVLKQAYTYVSASSKSREISNKNQILEPFSTLIKLAIISYKEDGIKIAVHNNKLYMQEPGMLQGTIRYAWGNNREEIHYLLKPLMRCIELYPPTDSNDLQFIYNQAILGLKKLKKNYNNGGSTVCYTIDLYINILEQKLIDRSIHIDSYDNSQKIHEDLQLSTNTKVNLDKAFDGIWNENDIVLLGSLFKSVNKNKGLNNESYLKSIENIILAKEDIIEDKIMKINNLI